MSNFAQGILDFHFQLKPDWQLPEGIDLIYPYDNSAIRAAMEVFYRKYFSDQNQRVFIFGINPGRFGSGVTGIAFTDPIRLKEVCGIDHNFPLRRELSSEFVYQYIAAYGGVDTFYQRFYITSLCPLGFLKDGKNYNYYDRKSLERAAEPHIIDSIINQLAFGGRKDIAICMGEGQNYRYFKQLNEQHQFFDRIIPLAHPRYVLQYKRRYLDDYLQAYLQAFAEADQALN